MKTNESAENYLETILILSQKRPVVRSVDIAEELGFKKSSVSVAMKNLREKEHITVTKEGFIYLTESGKAIADMIYELLPQKMPAAWNTSSAKKVLKRSKIILNHTADHKKHL